MSTRPSVTRDPVHAGVEAVDRIRRGAELAGRATVRGFVEFYESDSVTFAASIAYYSLLSLFPFLLLVLTVLTKVAAASQTPAGPTLLHLMNSALPRRFDFIGTQLQDLASAPLNLTLAGTVVMLWASTGVFGAITSAVNHAWDAEQPYGFLKHKVVAFVMMLAAGLLAVTALLLVGAVQVVESGRLVTVIASVPAIGQLSGFVLRNLPTPMFIGVVWLIYYFIPNAPVRLRDVWFGAVLAGLLWRLAFAGFAWYMADFSRFTVHGSVTAVVVFLVWVYISAVILLYGAEVSAAYAHLLEEAHARGAGAP